MLTFQKKITLLLSIFFLEMYKIFIDIPSMILYQNVHSFFKNKYSVVKLININSSKQLKNVIHPGPFAL